MMIYIYYHNEQERKAAEKYSKSEVFDDCIGSEAWGMISDLNDIIWDTKNNGTVKIIDMMMLYPLLNKDINKIGFISPLVEEIELARVQNRSFELLFLLPETIYNDPVSVRSKLFHELKIHALGKFKPQTSSTIYGTFRSNPFLFTVDKVLIGFTSLTPEITKEITNVKI